MIYEAVVAGIKGVGDVAINILKEFHLSPEEALKAEAAIRQAEMQYTREMWQLEIADKDSARKREIATADPTTHRLAYLYTGGYFGIFVLLISGAFTVQTDIKQLVDVLMAVLTAGQYSILAYYFGSSHGSAKKDVTLDRVVNHRD